MKIIILLSLIAITLTRRVKNKDKELCISVTISSKYNVELKKDKGEIIEKESENEGRFKNLKLCSKSEKWAFHYGETITTNDNDVFVELIKCNVERRHILVEHFSYLQSECNYQPRAVKFEDSKLNPKIIIGYHDMKKGFFS